MATQKITFPDKSTGDTFSGVEATQVKSVVNNNADQMVYAFGQIEAPQIITAQKVDAPSGLGFTPALDVYKMPPNRFAAAVNPALYKIETNRNYYVSPDGDDANNGRSFATAKKSLTQLINTLNGDAAVTSASIILAPGRYDYTDSIGARGFSFDANIICPNGKAVFAEYAENPTWTENTEPGKDSVWTWAGVGADSYYSVYDKTNLDSEGRPKPLFNTLTPDTGQLREKRNSYFIGGSGAIAINTWDAREPDSDIIVVIAKGAQYVQTTPQNVYMENIVFEGGRESSSLSQVRIEHAADLSKTYFFNKCEFNYATKGNGFESKCSSNIIMFQCRAHGNYFDGLNYNSTDKVIAIGCIASSNGTTDNPNDNGSTGHDEAKIVRINGRYNQNKNRCVHDIHNCKIWMLGCEAGEPFGDGTTPYDDASFVFGRESSSDAVTAFLENCVSIGGGEGDFGVYGDSVLNVRNPIGADIVDTAPTATYQTY